MKLSVVLICLCVSSVQLQRPDDQLAVVDGVQSAAWTELRDMIVKLKERLEFSERQIEELNQRSPGALNVAFSFASGLNGYYGPFNTDTTIVFRKQITNVGNAFSPVTGVFTAPLRGVYYFRFNLLGLSDKHWTMVYLYKNYERIIKTSDPYNSSNQYTIGGVTLQLERGDLVYIQLLAKCEIYDNSENHSTFSGFLVFPL